MCERSRATAAAVVSTGSLLCVGIMLFLSACAASTLAQDLAWERWRQCSGYPAIRLKEIRPDGTVSIDSNHGAPLTAYRECMRKAAEEQASKGKAVQNVGAATATPILAPPGAPEWRRGHEWAFSWQSPRGKGMFVWSVDRVETIDGTEFYVIKGGRAESYWRRADLAFHMNKGLQR